MFQQILRDLRAAVDDITSNLVRDLSEALTDGQPFDDIGRIFVNSVVTSLNDQLQENIEDQLNIIFNSFSNALFGALGGAVSGLPAGTGGGGVLGSIAGFFSGFFQEGGVVPGSGPTPAIVHGGEAILNPQQQRALFRDGGTAGGNQAPNITNINISGNVDQRSIDQIRRVIAASPQQVNSANMSFETNTTGLRRR